MADQADLFAIHAACRAGNAALVESLLQADPKLALRMDDSGRLPIHWATSHNHVDIVRLLVQVKEFDADVRDDIGWTPLMVAASIPDGGPLVDLFLSKGADVNAKNDRGQTALFLVVSRKDLDLARRLLALSPPASARVRDKHDCTPLHRAAAVGSTPMVELLLQHGSPLNAADDAGFTALHTAVAEGDGATAVALLKAGADSTPRDYTNRLAIDWAPDREVRKYILQTAEREGLHVQT